MAYVYFPNGAHQNYWWPTGAGADFTLGKTMQPLVGLQKSIQVLSGLDHKNATAGNDGAGDHARANATFLTGARARKTDSTDIAVGVSVDQIAARSVGHSHCPTNKAGTTLGAYITFPDRQYIPR
jgi:hypothetical protein